MKTAKPASMNIIIKENGVVGGPDGYVAVFIAKIKEKACILFIRKTDKEKLAQSLAQNKEAIVLDNMNLIVAAENEDGLFYPYPVSVGLKITDRWYINSTINNQFFYLSYAKIISKEKGSGIEEVYCATFGTEQIDIPENDVLLPWN